MGEDMIYVSASRPWTACGPHDPKDVKVLPPDELGYTHLCTRCGLWLSESERALVQEQAAEGDEA